MADYVAAQASVLIVPSMKGFTTQLRAELKKVQAQVKVGAEPDLKGFQQKLRNELKTVEASVAVSARPDLKGFRQALRAELKTVEAKVAVQAEADMRGFWERLEAELKTHKPVVAVKTELDQASVAKTAAELEAARKAEEQRKIRIKIALEKDEFRKSLDQVRSQYQAFKHEMAKTSIINFTVAGLDLLPQANAALAALNQSIVTLSQSALMLPGVFAGVGASLGALVVGSHGVVSSLTAMVNEQKNSVTAAREQREALQEVNIASNELKRSTRDAARNLEDLNDRLREAPLDEADALLQLQEARAQAAKKWGKTQLEQQRDALSVQRAEVNLAETRKRNTRLAQDAAVANQKGVAGTDSVVAATSRLAMAQQRAAKAGFKFSDQFALLSPAAQHFVQQVSSMTGVWHQLENGVQDKLFAGLAGDVSGLAGRLPMVQSGLEGIAKSLNSNVRAAIKSVGSEQESGLISRVFGNTAQAQSILSGGIDPLIAGVSKLSAVGTEMLPQLAAGFDRVAERFEGFINRADKDGSLKKWMEKGRKSLDDLGNSLINIGSILNSVSDAFTGSGGRGFLEVLATGTKRLAEFLKSAEGQEKLVGYFHNLREELAKFKPLLEEMPGLYRAVKTAISDWFTTAGPQFSMLASVLSQHPALIETIFTAFMAWRQIMPIVSGLKIFMDGPFGDAIRHAIAAVGTGYSSGGLTGAIGVLARGLGKGLLLGALSIAADFLVTRWVHAQEVAANAVENHKKQVQELRDELDGLSGSLTKEGQAREIKRLRNYTQADGLGGEFDALKTGEKAGVSQHDLTQSIDPTQQKLRDDTLRKLDTDQQKNIESSEFWKRFGKVYTDAGVSSEVLAKALNGDPSSIETFKHAHWTHDNMDPGFNLADLLHQKVGAGVPSLGDKSTDIARTGGVIRSESQTMLAQGDEARQDNKILNGNASLNPSGTAFFGRFGSPRAYPDADGGMSVTVDARSLPPDVLQQIEEAGGQVTQLANGSQIRLPKKLATQWADIPWQNHATGGWAFGAGSGTSDSIFSKLSNGEFVVKAREAAKHGALLEALNAGRVQPGVFPGFSGGGHVGAPLDIPVKPPTPPPSPIDQYKGDPLKSSLFLPALQQPEAPTPPNPLSVLGIPDNRPAMPVPAPPPPPVANNAPTDLGNGPKDLANLPKLSPPQNGAVTAREPEHHFGTGAPPGPPPIKTADPIPGVPASTVPTLDVPSISEDAEPPVMNQGLQMLENALQGFGGILIRGLLGFFGINADALLGPLQQLMGGIGQNGPKGGLGAMLNPNAQNNPQAQADMNSFDAHTISDVKPGEMFSNPASLASTLRLSGSTTNAFDDAVRRGAETNGPLYKPGLNTGGYGNSKGLPQWAIDLGAKFGLAPSTYNEGGTLHERGYAMDFAPVAGNTDGAGSMNRFAQFIQDHLGSQTLELIHANAQGQKWGIAGGRQVGPGTDMPGYYANDWSGHLDHVHWATDIAPLIAKADQAASGEASAGLVSMVKPAAGGGVRDQVRKSFDEAGFDPSQWGDLDWIMNRESGWNPGARNPSSGAYGLFQFLGHQGDKYGQLGGYSSDAYEQGRAGMAYIKDRYGDPAAARQFWQVHGWYADGGHISGPGSGTSDSILARLSNGEFVVRKSSVDKYGLSMLHSINQGEYPGFAGGGLINIPMTSPNPNFKTADPTPQYPIQAAGSPGGIDIHQPMPSSDPNNDPRSKLGSAPTNLDHNNPALEQGIQGAAGTIGGLAAMAAQMGITAGAAGAGGGPAGAVAGAAAAQGIQAGAQMAGQVASGALNILSSFLVGSVPGSKGGDTPGPYGAPLVPQQQSKSLGGPAVVNNYQGGIHVGNYDEFYRGQQRREAQQAQPYLGAITV